MKTRLGIFLLTLLISCLSLSGQEKRALLIGIGKYAPETGWHHIHGDNDVALTKAVLQRNGFAGNNITTLVNEEATFAAIDAALSRLVSTAKSKDIIYIQFSGHGQQITDLDGDEDDGLDECWIPYDARKSYQAGIYEGQNHFTDDRLFGYLSRLRSRIGSSGKIVVISDPGGVQRLPGSDRVVKKMILSEERTRSSLFRMLNRQNDSGVALRSMYSGSLSPLASLIKQTMSTDFRMVGIVAR